MNTKYVSIDRIFSKLIRDATDQFSEGDVIEWCGEALEFIGAVKSYQEAIAYIEVKNHQCQLPRWLHAIIQIARNNSWSKSTSDLLCPQTVITNLTNTPFLQIGDQCADCGDTPSDVVPTTPDFIVLDCNGQPINDYDIAYYRPYFDLQYEYYNWRSSAYYRNNYTPVRLRTTSFFDTLVCSTSDDNINSSVYGNKNTIDEYTIIQGDTLRFNFKEGSIALSYLRQIVDPKTGYPMIPEHVSYTTAIVKYIMYKMADKDYCNNREGAKGRLDKYESDWHWYCKQAGNAAMIPNGIDEHQNLADQLNYMIPRNNSYYNFFGNLATPEARPWNDPNRRNQGALYFKGN